MIDTLNDTIKSVREMLLLDTNHKIPEDIHEFDEKQTKIRNVTINYATIGKGEPIVFVHGWTNNWMGWVPLARELKNDYTLYLLDLPGYGKSGSVKKYSVEQQADYVVDFITALHLRPTAIVGLSMGSYIVGMIAKKYPDITKHVILIGAVFKVGTTHITQGVLRRSLQEIQEYESVASMFKLVMEIRLSAYLFSKYINMHEFKSAIVDYYGMLGRKLQTKEALVDMGISFSSTRLEEVLHKTQTPTLFLHGESDKVTGSKDSQKILRKTKGKFYFKTIGRAGHVASVEQPEPIAKEIKKFLRN